MLGEGRHVGDRRPMRLDLAVDESGWFHVRVGEQPWTLLDAAQLDDDGEEEGGCWLRGVFRADRQTAETNRRDYLMHLELKRYITRSSSETTEAAEEGDQEGEDVGAAVLLCGSCTALSSNADTVRIGNALTDFVSLRKRARQ